tara:strand:+ start:2153 stop:2431 length:279 start_codon:yes stop_codon:yes gene_type:complete
MGETAMNNGHEGRSASSVAGILAFAATPVCTMMALVIGLSDSPHSMHDSSWWTGMAAMYVLMGMLHLAPWLDWLLRRWRRGAGMNQSIPDEF